MTRDNMKSDLAECNKVKIERRQSIHRRKMSRFEGGSSAHTIDSDLTLAIQESLKYSKQTASHKTVDRPSSSVSMGDNHLTYEDLQTKREDSHETKQLKELLLVHLDLIQQQQELILAKDRQIQTLRTERETLRCRLERMERRVSLVRHKNDNQLPVSAPSSANKECHHNRGIKRRGSLEPQSLSKRFAGINSTPEKQKIPCGRKAAGSATKDSSTDSLVLSSRRSHQKHEDTRPHNNRMNRVPPHLRRWPGSDEEAETTRKPQINQVVFKYSRKPENVLRSEDSYYVSHCPEPPVDISPVKPKKKDNVHVPTWRINPIPTGYQMEGTERLDDDIYARRHNKPEHEEKRRKRWDLQRMRDQSLYEKLQKNRANEFSSSSTRKQQDNMISFYPHPEDAKYIEVSDKVPVSAFGYPLPNIKAKEFELPWDFSCDKREKEEKHKSSRNKRR